MKVVDAIKTLRDRINDDQELGFEEETLINYINDAIGFFSIVLIDRLDPILTKTLIVDSAAQNLVPKNFIKFAGGFPVKKIGNVFEIVDGSPQVSVKYFYTAPNITTADDLPFDHDLYNTVIIRLAAVYALNQHEFDVGQDQGLIDRLNEVISSVLQK